MINKQSDTQKDTCKKHKIIAISIYSIFSLLIIWGLTFSAIYILDWSWWIMILSLAFTEAIHNNFISTLRD